jgi:hypothetical protein
MRPDSRCQVGNEVHPVLAEIEFFSSLRMTVGNSEKRDPEQAVPKKEVVRSCPRPDLDRVPDC